VAQETRMPVSKKRKKEGKPVQRQAPSEGDASKATDHPEGGTAQPPLRAGKPKNPFAAQPQHRGSLRGR
jgi:hypothetical protein